VWDLERRVSTLRCHQRHLHSAINSLDIHHPTELIACVHKGKRVRFWDRRVGNRFQEILTTGHAHLVHAVAFTKYPTSSKISTTTTTTSTSTATTDWLMVTASKDTTARLWDIRTLGSRAVPLAILREHAAAIRAVSMDRSKIITGGKGLLNLNLNLNLNLTLHFSPFPNFFLFVVVMSYSVMFV
jgi:WD40 repeat protein